MTRRPTPDTRRRGALARGCSALHGDARDMVGNSVALHGRMQGRASVRVAVHAEPDDALCGPEMEGKVRLKPGPARTMAWTGP